MTVSYRRTLDAGLFLSTLSLRTKKVSPRLRLALLVLAVSLPTACAKTDDKAKPAATGAASKAPATSDSATAEKTAVDLAFPAPVPPDPTCDLPNRPMDCPGVLQGIVAPTMAELDAALVRGGYAPILIDDGHGKSRKHTCNTVNCNGYFYVKPLVFKFSRWFDFENTNGKPQLPLGYSIIIGALDFPTHSPYDDIAYKIGKHLEKERVYIIAYRQAGDETLPPQPHGRIIAHWKMYSVSNANVVTPGSYGNILRCTSDHAGYRNKISARFLGCDGEGTYALAEAVTGNSFATYLAAGACARDFKPDSTKAAECGTPSTKFAALMALPSNDGKIGLTKEANEWLAYLTDESDALYWFSCANGCCSAADVKT